LKKTTKPFKIKTILNDDIRKENKINKSTWIEK